MPLTTKHGSIFDSKAEVLVCPVNCVGVMGKGLALEFKRRWPKRAQHYEYACKTGILSAGRIYPVAGTIYAATKRHWANPSKIEWVESCLTSIANQNGIYDWPSIAIPQLGCGCGGLDWADVWPLYEKHLGDSPADVESDAKRRPWYD